MKSISRQLQSRISLRRNYIAFRESEADAFKSIGFGYMARNIRNGIKPLALDQKLDKQLFNIVNFVGV